MIKQEVVVKNQYERAAWQNNATVCGVDEVGRGSLAGPVVACAVVLPIGIIAPDFLKDSKLMSARQREQASIWIQNECQYAFGIIDHRRIDAENIYQSTLKAMQKALINLFAQYPALPSAIIVDAMPVRLEKTSYAHIPVHHFCKGESLSSSIAAASIMAKIYRDQLMSKLSTLFPGYFLDEHKGYGTAKHQEAIKTKHPTIIHRQTFLKKSMLKTESNNSFAILSHKNFVSLDTPKKIFHTPLTKSDHENQQSLC